MSKLVNQTQFGKKGDALQACFASLLGLQLSDVPNFILEPDYLQAIQTYLRKRGLGFLKVSFDESVRKGFGTLPFNLQGVPCIVVGISPLGGIRQCCVGVANTTNQISVLHDPHPDTDGFVEGSGPIWAGFFVSRLHPPPFASRVLQTEFGTKGNALQACFASLLGRKMADIPNFIQEDDYMQAIQAYLRPRFLGFLKISFDEDAEKLPFKLDGVPCVVAGKSPRGSHRHCCLGNVKTDSAGSCKVFVSHDPHPDGTGIDSAPVWAGFLVSLQPATAIVKSQL
jgi:hypothetical protein